MRRHHIRIGDLTTANGVVVSAASTFFLLEKQVATEGDKIACRSCHSTGTIICIGPRIPETYEGRQVALEGDLCACRCPGPPKLIPSQGVRFQDVEGSYAQAMGGAAGTAAGAASVLANSLSANQRTGRFDEQFLLRDKATGQPVSNFAYGMETDFGEHHDEIYEDGATVKAFSETPSPVKLLYAMQKKIGLRQ